MESAETPRRRRAPRPEKTKTEVPEAPSAAGTGEEAPSGLEAAAAAVPETPEAPAQTPAPKRSRAPRAAASTGLGDVAARRVADAGAAVGAQAAAGGNSITMPVAVPLSPAAALALGLDPKPQATHARLPETDAAMAAASAAAAAAVAAVSAAIAATAAANASKPGAPLDTPATLIEAAAIQSETLATPELASPASVASVASAETVLEASAPEPQPETTFIAAAAAAEPEVLATPPSRPQLDSRHAPVTVSGYVRPPARDVPGLIRAHREDDSLETPDEMTAQAADAASGASSVAGEQPSSSGASVKRRAAAAGIATALLAAATAFGHRAVPALKSAGATAGHVATVPVRVGNRLFSRGTPAPVYDEYGTEQRRRRLAPGWLLFVGFYGLIFAAIGANLIFGAPPAEGSHPSPSSKALAAATITATPTDTATVAPVIGTLTTDPPTATPSPEPTATPSPTATPTPPPTTKPTPKPTARRTATPTKAPTPVPTPRPTPSPTPARNFASFAASGTRITVGTTVYTATYTATYRSPSGLTLILYGLGGSTCTLSRTGSSTWHPSSLIPGTAPTTNAMIVTPAGTTWAVGSYTISASCTQGGFPTATASVNVTITA